MPDQIIEALVEGGKASAGPPIGPSLGPTGVNIGEVISTINQKTGDFKGMKVPIKIIVKEDKTFDIEVGTPPASQLIKKELNIQKGSGIPNKEKVGNMAIEQAIKITKMKQDSLFLNDLKSGVKTIAGSANAMGILTEGKPSTDFNKDLDSGMFDEELKSEKTEVSAEKLKSLQEQLGSIQKEMQKELERIKAQEEAEKAEEAKKKEAAEEAEKPEEEKEGKEREKKEAKPEEKKPEEKKEEKK